MGGYPRSCEEVIEDLQERQKSSEEDHRQHLNIEEDAILHRLVRLDDVDSNTQKPKSCAFTSPGLSVLIESPLFPSLDVEKEIAESELFVGSVFLKASFVRAQGFEIYCDPYPDPLGKPQHPNHAQVVCKKTQSKAKAMKEACEWSVRPTSL